MSGKSEQVRAYALAQVGGPYIYGATAQPCTLAYRMARMDQYPEYADKIRDACPALSGDGVGCSGCQYDGRIAHDCAQLTRYAAQAAGLTLPSGATSQWEDGDWAASGLIATMPGGTVCFVYRRSSGRMVHTGVCLGDGTVIEARGHRDGVVHGDAADYPWTHWGILRGMDVPEGAGLLPDYPVLRKGAVGDDVHRLQEQLLAAGYTVGGKGADGVFGAATREAVLALQRDGGAKVDGVVGEETWCLLDRMATGPRYEVRIAGLTEPVARRIIEAYGGTMTEQEVST